MKNQSIKYDELPSKWMEGLPIGNGNIGVMFWGDDRQLKFSLDHAEAWDLRHDPVAQSVTYQKVRNCVENGDFESNKSISTSSKTYPTKIHLGRFDLEFEIASCSSCALAIADAKISAELEINKSSCSLEAFTAKDKDIFCLRLSQWPKNAKLKYLPFYVTSPGLASLEHPGIDICEEDNLTVAIQHILPDKFFAICWNITGPEVFISVSKSDNLDDAKQQSIKNHPHKSAQSYDNLYMDHKKSWAEFWSISAVALPEKKINFYWFYGLYILASCARKDGIPPGLQGLWAMDGKNPPWRGGYVTDMNVQEMFWSAYTSNHLDLVDVWLDFMLKMLPRAQEFTRNVFGKGGSFWRPSFLPEFSTQLSEGYGPVNFAWSCTGWLAQLAHLRWRYSMDKDWLEKTGYQLVKSAFIFYSENLELEDDGRYHIPLSNSPEYEEGKPDAWCKDPNVDIALIRKCCDWIVEMEDALEKDDLTIRAKEIHEHLVPYQLVDFDMPGNVRTPDTKILGLWKDKQLNHPHRHPSHLMAIHPAMDFTIDGNEEEKKLIDASLLQYLALGQFYWAGHTYVQMVSFAAVVGRAEMAYRFLREYINIWTLPNGLHFNGSNGVTGTSYFARPLDPNNPENKRRDLLVHDTHWPFTVNETCGITCGISDMLVQSWGGKIRIFPAIPVKWKDALFVDLLTEGGFKVSALKKDGYIQWLRIIATVAGPCQLQSPFKNKEFQISGPSPQEKDNLLVWTMSKGQTITLFTKGNEVIDTAKEIERIDQLTSGNKNQEKT